MTPAIQRLIELREKAWLNPEHRRLAADQLVQELKHVARAAGFEASRLLQGRRGITIAFPPEANINASVTIQANDVGLILVWYDAQRPEELRLQFDPVQGCFVQHNGAEPLDALTDCAARHLEASLTACGVSLRQG